MLHFKIEVKRTYVPLGFHNIGSRYKIFIIRPDQKRLEYPAKHDPYGFEKTEVVVNIKHLSCFFDADIVYVDCQLRDFES